MISVSNESEDKGMTEEQIREEFIKGYDCSQVVLRAFAGELGISEDESNRVAACFGGGMMLGEACGVFTGAMMAIGLKYGHSNPENLMEQKEIMMEKSAQFRREFLKRHATVVCKPLLGYDVSKPEGLQAALESGHMLEFCPMLAKETLDILRDIL